MFAYIACILKNWEKFWRDSLSLLMDEFTLVTLLKPYNVFDENVLSDKVLDEYCFGWDVLKRNGALGGNGILSQKELISHWP